MKTLFPIILSLLLAVPALAQVVNPNSKPTAVATPSPTPADADIDGAVQFSTEFLDDVYARDFNEAAEKMNLTPPYWKGTRSELKKLRIDDFKKILEKRSDYGPATYREVVSAQRTNLSERPDTEEFFLLSYRYTFADGRTAFDMVRVMKKDGQYSIEMLR